MRCCDDPECECNNPICPSCGAELFGFEMGPECDACLGLENFGPTNLNTHDPEAKELARRAAKKAAQKPLAREGLGRKAKLAFEEMLHRGKALTLKQRAWLQNALGGEKYDHEPSYENLWSNGVVPKGGEVVTPDVLRCLPKKPPVRVNGGR